MPGVIAATLSRGGGAVKSVARGQGGDLGRGEAAGVDADLVDVALEVVDGGVAGVVAVPAHEQIFAAIEEDRQGVGAVDAHDTVDVDQHGGRADHAGHVVPVAVEVAARHAQALHVAAGGALRDLDVADVQAHEVVFSGAHQLGAARRAAAGVDGGGAVPDADADVGGRLDAGGHVGERHRVAVGAHERPARGVGEGEHRHHRRGGG